MKICLLGEYEGSLDEGMRKVSFILLEQLSKHHKVLPLDLRNVFSKTFWKDLRRFNPQVVHYLFGPTFRSFVLLKGISSYCHNVKTVMSSMRPYFSSFSKYLIPPFKPNLVLVQSYETEKVFKKLGCKTEFLPCGVDTTRFTPYTMEAKNEFKEKYGINKEKFIILHIGSIKKGRNIQLFEKLQKENNQVVIVGSTSTGINQKTYQQLMRKGCLIWINYFERIEEIYALSDCYVFPVVPKKDIMGRHIADSIEMPLSVLEAMSCNLPVITTKFGALFRVFNNGEGLFFVDGENGFVDAIERIKKKDIDVKTREKVLPYTWKNVVERLEKIYEELVFQ
jgi:glycosyltransferase involved in cell wall biosynthesis